jgi:hypothetical protein
VRTGGGSTTTFAAGATAIASSLSVPQLSSVRVLWESEKTYEKGADFSEKIACERRLEAGRYLCRLWLR